MTYATKEKNPELIGFAKTLRNVPWCEQYEKMISGMSYNGYGPELSNARFRARKLVNKYNTHFPDDATLESLSAEREEMLQEMIGSIAKGSFIEPPFNVDYGCNISIGHTFYSNFGLTVLDCGIVRIGDRVVCGPHVSIFAITHDTEIESRRKFGEYTKPVTIGNDCWIGANVVIMPGVTIGKGCTIGAASVVTHDIPEFSVAVGSPAKVIKKVDPVPDL